MNYLSLILFLLIFAKLFFSEKKKKSFKQALINIENELHQKGQEWTALSPIYYISLFFDRYLGEKLFSRLSIIRISIFTIILTIATIWSANIHGGDFLKNSPSKIWNEQIQLSEKMISINNATTTNKPDNSVQEKK